MSYDLIKEMTMRSGSLDPANVAHVPEIIKKDGVKNGYMDHCVVYKVEFKDIPNSYIYSINDDSGENIAAWVNVVDDTIEDKPAYKVMVMQSLDGYQNKGYMSRLFWYLKHHEGRILIDHGFLSLDGYDYYTRIGNSKRFETYWYNIETKEKVPFVNDPKYYNIMKPTEWRILIEGDGFGDNKADRWAYHRDFPVGQCLRQPFKFINEDGTDNI